MTRAPSFDRVARVYRWAEYLALGPLLERTRNHFLAELGDRRRALVLGDGDGRFLAKLLRQNRDLQAVAVDSSEGMLRLLQRRCDVERVETVWADALTIPAPADIDLIVTHFFLDCFTQEEITALARRLAQNSRPGTLWLVSDFRIPENALRPLARAYVRSLYFVFRVLTGLRVTRLPDAALALSAAGFDLMSRHGTLGGILYTELWRFRGLGV